MAEGVAVEPRRRNGRPPGSAFWLIFADEHQMMHPATVDLPGGGEALAVFSSEEEAEMFLWLGMEGDGWRTRKTSAGEVISLLYGPCSETGSVALDPFPEMLADGLTGPVALDRLRFLERVARRGLTREPASYWMTVYLSRQ
jgi:hypothetical protein